MQRFEIVREKVLYKPILIKLAFNILVNKYTTAGKLALSDRAVTELDRESAADHRTDTGNTSRRKTPPKKWLMA